MSVARPDEVWLLARVRPGDSGVTEHGLLRFDGRWRAFGASDAGSDTWPVCNATGLSAVPQGFGATDVWLIGAVAPCGDLVTSAANDAGPVSRLQVRRIRYRSFLPTAER